ncbi:MAG: hypothetical protein KBT27_01330 [Prevotellaceae bacterium]|nr:hypothetical protein [Candidatus Faecinaster equi]
MKTDNDIVFLDAIKNMVDVYIVECKLDKALSLLDDAISMQPDIAELYKIRGQIKLKLNDKMGAMDDAKKAIEIDPKMFDGKFEI